MKKFILMMLVFGAVFLMACGDDSETDKVNENLHTEFYLKAAYCDVNKSSYLAFSAINSERAEELQKIIDDYSGTSNPLLIEVLEDDEIIISGYNTLSENQKSISEYFDELSPVFSNTGKNIENQNYNDLFSVEICDYYDEILAAEIKYNDVAIDLFLNLSYKYEDNIERKKTFEDYQKLAKEFESLNEEYETLTKDIKFLRETLNSNY